MHLPFDDARIDRAATIVDASVREDLWLEGLAIDFHGGDMDLGRVGERQVTVFALDVRESKRRVVNVAAVECDVPKVFGHSRIVYVYEVGQSPIVDRFLASFVADLRSLRTDTELQILPLGL